MTWGFLRRGVFRTFFAATGLLFGICTAGSAQEAGEWIEGFVPGGLNERVYALAVHGQTVYAGGRFTAAGDVVTNYVAKWDGVSWSPLGSGLDSQVKALAVGKTRILYVGGTFRSTGGASANHVAKWNGSSWSPLGIGMEYNVLALAIDASGDLYAGGSFITAGLVSANRVAKWDGSSWSALGTGLNDRVYTLTLDKTNTLYAGGSFCTAGGVVSSYIGGWIPDPIFSDGFESGDTSAWSITVGGP